MAARVYKIPLTAIPQRFAIDLAGRPFVVVSRWNGNAPSWQLDLLDGDTEAPVVLNLSVVTGVDLLMQHRHLQLGGSLVAVTDGNEDADPTDQNIGAEGNVYFLADEA